MTGVAPDKFGVEMGWRAWLLGTDGLLRSPTYPATWTPDEPFTAECRKPVETKFEWVLMSIEEAIGRELPLHREWEAPRRGREDETDYVNEGTFLPRPPRVELPFDLTYAYTKVEPDPHQAPHKDCTCGVYAAQTPEQCAAHGKYVVGRVSLWGTVVPGEKGWRAERAYPSEIFVLKSPLEDRSNAIPSLTWMSFSMFREPEKKPTADAIAALEEYGVPVHHVNNISEAKKLVAVA